MPGTGNRRTEGAETARKLRGRTETDSTERGESSKVTLFNMDYSGVQVAINKENESLQ